MKGFRLSLIFLFGKRNGETNTFPRSDWPGDGSVQYQGNIHWDSILHGGIHSEYTVEDHHKYIMKQRQQNIHWDMEEYAVEDHRKYIKKQYQANIQLGLDTYYIEEYTGNTQWKIMTNTSHLYYGDRLERYNANNASLDQ